jgi:protein-disulfide isomerase/uncharacterized membrane protein
MTLARAEDQPETAVPRSLGRTVVLLVPVLAGLAASAILAVDYARPLPVFCDPEGGCAALKQTMFASFLHVPTPVYGLFGFLLLGALTMQSGKWVRTLLLAVASVCALVGGGLFLVQLQAHTWCKFCLVADTSGLVLFGLALWRKLSPWDPPEERLPHLAMGSAMVLAVAAPVGVGFLKKPIVPEAIAREIAQTRARDKREVTVVDFADFECPFCRMTHATLAPLLAEHHDHLRVVRKNVPITRLHPHALDAARAACCGEQMGKGEAMADALFSAPVDDLTPEGCAKLAVSLGLDPAAFEKCTKDPATDARIKDDQAVFKATQGHGLPTLWIDEEKIEGYRGDDTVERTLERAIGKRG